ncbi:hypothetical protein AB6D81_25665 [Vibrio splendidus]|uniref:hypothetical protein n=1 Tax=Vibrio atlanticus TaxID=693153 RepID=UPI003552FF21
MNLSEFLSLVEHGEFSLSPEEAQKLNTNLASKSLAEIPESIKVDLADYLVTALNMNSVEPAIEPQLSELLRQLQEHA